MVASTADFDWLFARFERVIARDQRALRVYVSFTLAVVALGLFLILLSFLLTPSSTSVELLLRIGGGFVASLAALPLKELIDRASRIGGMRDMAELWREVASADEPSSAFLARIEDLIWQMIEARVGIG